MDDNSLEEEDLEEDKSLNGSELKLDRLEEEGRMEDYVYHSLISSFQSPPLHHLYPTQLP